MLCAIATRPYPSAPPYRWRVSADLDGDSSGAFLGGPDLGNVGQLASFSGGPGGSALLEDAYASWSVSDEISIVWGSFKAPTSLSNQVDPENLVMIRRTIAGRALEDWQLGAMLQGCFDQFAGFLAVQNGNDGIADEYRITARGEYHINGGAGGGSGRLGAHGSETDDLAATFGVTFRDDETAGIGGGSDTTIIVVDGAATFSQFGLHGEFVSLDDDIGDGDIFALTGSMSISDSLEAAIRFQQSDLFDDASEIDSITAGVSYIQEGARWAINVSDLDDGDLDGTVIEAGLTIGQSRR